MIVIIAFTIMLRPLQNGHVNIKINEENNTNLKSAASGIIIDNTNIASYSSSGTGAVDDPYIIKDLNINTTDSIAIKFDSVSSYFILRDSFFNGSTYGLYMSAVSSGMAKIINNTIIGALAAGSINGGYETLYNNTFITNAGGSFGNHLNATNNIFIGIGESSSLINLGINNNIILKNNTFYGENSNINLRRITDSTIENNILYGVGFAFGKDDTVNVLSNTFTNNIINGKPFGFLYNRTDEQFTNNQYGQIVLVNSSNVAIKNYDLRNISTAITVTNCTGISIEDTSISAKNGVDVLKTNDFSIENCNFAECGIKMEITNRSIVHNNYFSNNFESIYGSEINLVHISNNTINNDTEIGIYLEDASNVSISFNIVSTFIQTEGSEMPIYIYSGQNVTVYYNIFISTGNQTAYLAEESSSDIVWYNNDTQTGNYWSNWNGTGNYSIEGDDAQADLYPFTDFDDDNLNETLEVIEYGTDPFNPDSDSDGLNDGAEVNTYNTNPLSNDSDSDLMDDNWEVSNGTNPTQDDAADDLDNDGLTNFEEFGLGTDVNNNDTDSDGLPDGYEVNNSFDPFVNDSSGDADLDGLTNLEEYNFGTDPNEIDTDGDGFSDFIEIQKGTDPLDPDSFPKSPLGLILGIVGGVIVLGGFLFIAVNKKWIKIPIKLKKA
ncbi:MAG: NosD domain-containing protein [Promethearchaeota archaeon]